MELIPYFQDSSCTIYHGDCRDILPSLKADLVLTDPPFGVMLGDKNRTNMMTKHGNEGYGFTDDVDYVVRVAVPVVDICRKVAVRVLVTPGLKNLWAYPEPDALWGIYFPNGAGVGRWKAFVCWQPLLCYGPSPTYKGCFPDTFFATEQADKNGHPCPKPLEVWRRILARMVGMGGGSVIDPFMGSGTTLRAAKDLQCKAIGIEIEERYCEIAAKRLAQNVLGFSE